MYGNYGNTVHVDACATSLKHLCWRVQDIEERDSFQEAHEKMKTCDRKHYKADPEGKKDSKKAQCM